jgi:hypothetical protein
MLFQLQLLLLLEHVLLLVQARRSTAHASSTSIQSITHHLHLLVFTGRAEVARLTLAIGKIEHEVRHSTNILR